MNKAYVFLCLLASIVLIPAPLWSQDTTRSDYFARAAFGGGFTSVISSCNTSANAVFRRTIFREGTTGDILHEEQGLILGFGCNISIFEDMGDLRAGSLEQMITGPVESQVISSLFLAFDIGGGTADEVRINPEEPTSAFRISFSEGPTSRNAVALVDTAGDGFSCSVTYRDSLGVPMEGQSIQAGANQSVGRFLDEIVSDLPDGFGWAAFSCSSDVSAVTLSLNPSTGNFSAGKVFLPSS